MRGQCTGAPVRGEKCEGLMRGSEKAAAAYTKLLSRREDRKVEGESGEEDGWSGREMVGRLGICRERERKYNNQAMVKLKGSRGHFYSILCKPSSTTCSSSLSSISPLSVFASPFTKLQFALLTQHKSLLVKIRGRFKK